MNRPRRQLSKELDAHYGRHAGRLFWWWGIWAVTLVSTLLSGSRMSAALCLAAFVVSMIDFIIVTWEAP